MSVEVPPVPRSRDLAVALAPSLPAPPTVETSQASLESSKYHDVWRDNTVTAQAPRKPYLRISSNHCCRRSNTDWRLAVSHRVIAFRLLHPGCRMATSATSQRSVRNDVISTCKRNEWQVSSTLQVPTR